jgi:hypothetical protein
MKEAMFGINGDYENLVKSPADFAIYNLSGHEVYKTNLVEGVTQLKINSSLWEPGFL